MPKEISSINKTILNFWFTPPIKNHWFSSTPEIDQKIFDNYHTLWQEAQSGQYDELKNTATGCLALCILLDQFPLNMFRGKPESFSTEQQAVAVSKQAIQNKLDKALSDEQVMFLYMPLMHSENIDDQNLSVHSFEKRGLDTRFAKHHREIIKTFGRFPHRNQILKRKSTKEELEYLASDKAFTG